MPAIRRSRHTPWRGEPRDVQPMLAELAEPRSHDRLLQRDDLIFEPKYDGMRALVHVSPEPHVELYSRTGNNKTAQFPEVVEPLERFARRLEGPVLLDGELVAVDAEGTPLGFQHLQGRLHVRGLKTHSASRATAVALIVFDLLRDGAEDLRGRPFTERRQRLEQIMRRPGSRALRLIKSATGGGDRLRKQALRLGWEGLVAKDAKARYVSGRHPAWQKIKFVLTEELVVGGWTDPRETRTHFGALLLGYHPLDTPASRSPRSRPKTTKRPGLIFAGQVGSGFTQAELARVWARLEALSTDTTPFVDGPRSPGPGHWVRPTLVAQVKFTEWTLDGLLRNPVYLGLREDRPASEICLPDRRPDTAASTGRVTPTRPARTRRPVSRGPRPRHPEPRLEMLLDALTELEQQKTRGILELSDGARISVGNLEKVFWPEPGITKGDLLRFSLRMAPYALPVVADRPLVMKRFPNGVRGKSFYQHRAPDRVPDGLRVVNVRERPDKAGSEVPYLVGGSLHTLLYMAQLAVISQDPWFSRVDTITEADQVALDLDPMPDASFDRVLDVACWLHDELETLGVPSFVKTSGSEGLHIFIPLPPGTPYEAGTIFCQIVATVVATRHPTSATVERMVKRRAQDAVYIDYLQNIYGKTLAAAYSARASEFAGVSTPLAWAEVHDGVRSGMRPGDFTIRTILSRLENTGDLWAALRSAKPARLEAAFSYGSV